jgi:lipopolysaccharide export system permease protein
MRSLGVSLFLLTIQFISRYKGDIFGKGLDTWVLFKIFAFASTSLMVMALPVSVLLASLFSMGNFGEHYELAAMRSGGLSLQRILRPMVLATIVISLISFAMSSYIVPLSNLKLYSLLYDVQKMKPAFTLQPGHFNAAVDNYVIRISDKDISTDVLYDVMIYDHTSGLGNDRMIRADSGSLIMDPYGQYMHMTLNQGVSYEVRHGMGLGTGADPLSEGMVRFYFDSLLYNFDLAGFNLERTEEVAFSTHQYMLNLRQLQTAIDSFDNVKAILRNEYISKVSPKLGIDSAMVYSPEAKLGVPPKNMLDKFPKTYHKQILTQAIQRIQQSQELNTALQAGLQNADSEKRLREIELHAKYSLPIACIVFLFVGAPLGAIIRKGGAGIPILVSMTLYLAFYVIMIQGKKMATEAVLPVWMGVWLPNLVMMPLAGYLTFESSSTQNLLSGEVIQAILRFLVRLFALYLNPLYWLWSIPPVQRGIIFVLRPIVRRFFPERKETQPRFRVRR